MPRFEAWACAAIDDVLVKHQGSIHWLDLQKAVVERYFHDGPISSRHSPRVRCLSHRVLAEIPSSHLNRDDALVRLPKRKRCDETDQGDGSFTSWAKTAIQDTLTLHNDAMHWQGLQRALVQRYLEIRPVRKLKFEREVGKQVLARVPEAYLSHDDSSVHLCRQMQVTTRGTTKRGRIPSSMSSGRGRRKLMRRLKVRLVAKRSPLTADCDVDNSLAATPTLTQPAMDTKKPAVMSQPLGSPVIPELHPVPQAAAGPQNSRSAFLLSPAQPVVDLEQPAVLCLPTIPPAPLARLQNLKSVLSTTASAETEFLYASKYLSVAVDRPAAATASVPPLSQQHVATVSKPPASPPMLPKFVNGRLQYASIPQGSSSEKTLSLQSRAGGA